MNRSSLSHIARALLLMGVLSLIVTSVWFDRASATPDDCVAPPSGIISWWPGDGSGIDIADGNDGTVQGAGYGTGRVGQAFVFDGQDDYVFIPEGAGSALDGLSAMTVEAWINPTTYGWENPEPDSDNDAAIISKYNSTVNNGVSFHLSLRDGRLYFGVADEGNPQPVSTIIADSAVALGTWSHVAAVWDGEADLTLYLNGTTISSTVNSSAEPLVLSADNETPVNIGRIESFSDTHTGPAAFFDGGLDEVTVYGRALTSSEIAAIHAAPDKCKEGTVTPTPTDTSTATATSTSTPTATSTATSTPPPTPTATSLPTDTPVPTVTATSPPVPLSQFLSIIVKPLPSPTPTFTPTPSPTPTVQSGPVIVNGDFEQGHVGWAEYSAHGYPIILQEDDLPVPAYSGSWATWFGGEYDEASIIEQVVTIPNDRNSLRYWLWIASSDVCGVDYDIAGVLVNDEAVDAFLLCDDNDTNGWISRSVDLSNYQGQSVTLTFAAFTDSVLNSNLFIDDVSLGVPGQANPFIGYFSEGLGERLKSLAMVKETVPGSLTTEHEAALRQWLETR